MMRTYNGIISKRNDFIHIPIWYIFKNGKKRQFYMRKWPKKYFLDALALHPDFKGEVELLDHMTNFDYFAFYEESKKALKLKLRK